MVVQEPQGWDTYPYQTLVWRSILLGVESANFGVASLRVPDLVEALVKATTDEVMKERASALGERIASENGVHTAIHSIHTYLDRASQDRAYL